MTLRLLIADDNEATQKMVRLAFAGEDVVIEAVSSGDAALEILKEFRPDAALVDISMPGYSGYEVCELIRHDQEFASLPVILMSGALDLFDEDEAARVKASGHLAKPFNPSEMIDLVEELLPDVARSAEPGLPAAEAEELPSDCTCRAETGFPATEAEQADAGAAAEISSQPIVVQSAAPPVPRDLIQAAPHAWKSYLGPDRILDIISDETIAGKTAADWRAPEELIDRVAEKTVKKMIPDIKALIQQTLSANKSGSPSR